jgi:hypothetical protein
MRISDAIDRQRVAVSPGSRSYRRAINAILKQLAAIALSGRKGLTTRDEVALFTLVPEYAMLAVEAATLASSAIVTIDLPNGSLVMPENLISMLYLDHLIFGYAAFERAGDIVVYADPTQFTSITLKEDGSLSVVIREMEDVSDRVGVITLHPNPYVFGFSVPELIPQTFITLLLVRNRIVYEVSQFRKPEVMIVTSEVMSTDEVNSRRRQIIEQAEDDYGSFILYSHNAEDKPQVVVLDKKEVDLKDLDSIIEREVAILRKACGLPDDGRLSAVMVSFFDQLRSELERLFVEARVQVGLPDIVGDEE